jgi:hypothetical protein
MRKIIFLVCLSFVLMIPARGAILIFKAVDQVVRKDAPAEQTIDTSKYRQIRFIFRYKYPVDVPDIDIYAVEDSEDIHFLDKFFLENSKSDFLLDTPPTKLRVKITGFCKYSIYVWASE